MLICLVCASFFCTVPTLRCLCHHLPWSRSSNAAVVPAGTAATLADARASPTAPEPLARWLCTATPRHAHSACSARTTAGRAPGPRAAKCAMCLRSKSVAQVAQAKAGGSTMTMSS